MIESATNLVLFIWPSAEVHAALVMSLLLIMIRGSPLVVLSYYDNVPTYLRAMITMYHDVQGALVPMQQHLSSFKSWFKMIYNDLFVKLSVT